MTMKKVFVNGAFDVLHTGHLNLLEYAKSLGDYLLVAIDSDRRITYNKGPFRPFNDSELRYRLMSSLKPVDQVKFFDTDDDLIDIIKQYKPDIMVKGNDWYGKPIIGSNYCGEIIFYERNGQSTTKTIEDFINRRQLL